MAHDAMESNRFIQSGILFSDSYTGPICLGDRFLPAKPGLPGRSKLKTPTTFASIALAAIAAILAAGEARESINNRGKQDWQNEIK